MVDEYEVLPAREVSQRELKWGLLVATSESHIQNGPHTQLKMSLIPGPPQIQHHNTRHNAQNDNSLLPDVTSWPGTTNPHFGPAQ